ncbi:unnamed protein product [Somion occarium]|uniref:LIM zinc-binding domain-containing protein n=2 Tax=Somion occarium TaxID=3059160 RepID=A0ABP1DET5_9APHY
MAQLLAPKAPDPGRISQILPTVKCSSCNQPVPISELGDHVCAPPSPSSKPPMSPRSASFLSQKYQNMVSRSQTPPVPSPLSQGPPRQPSPLSAQAAKPPTQGSPLRPRAPSTASLNVPARPQRSPSPSSRDGPRNGGKVAFPTHSGPESPTVTSPLSMRQTSRSLRSGSSISSRSSTSSHVTSPLSSRPLEQQLPMPANMPRTNTPGLRARAPSNASVRSTAPSIRQPTQSSPTPYVPPPRFGGSQIDFQTGPEIIYSTSNRLADVPDFAPRPPTSPGPSMPSTGGFDLGQVIPNGHPISPAQMPYSPPAPDIDTKIGGEAGMAGVGRRGFAAAARAAMFANNMANAMDVGRDDQSAVFLNINAVQGMDGRRANAPNFLDIASARNYANTPPLSPNSGSSHSPHSPLSAALPSPDNEGRNSTTPTLPTIASRTPSPSGPGRPFMQGDRMIPPAPEPPKSPLPATPTTPVRLPFFEKFKNKHPPVDVTPEPAKEASSPLSPGGSESSFGGLAYADSSDDEDEKLPASAPPVLNKDLPVSPIAIPPVPKSASGPNKVRFPSMSSKTSSIHQPDFSYPSSSTVSPRLPQRSLSASTATSTYSVRSAAKSTGALDRAMETLFEEDATSTSASSPAMFPLTIGEGHRDSKPPKLPTRSHTSPILSAGRPDSKHGMGKRRAPKVRTCVKCDKHVDDGRWIQMDGGSVLCDKCWKNMYLPKCRRCNKTIEKAAVSSSDGQLKGKYHRECFSCFTCQKPFPDKSFYVFDGKPFCAYHYHEANDSLCAATACGQPIEGPCAVSHSGDKYHPEHFTCEWSRCNERLAEYWEVEGRMLCDKHAQIAMREGEFEDKDPLDGLGPFEGKAGDDRRDSVVAKATKRVTRFIDLAALNGGGGGGGDDSGLR